MRKNVHHHDGVVLLRRRDFRSLEHSAEEALDAGDDPAFEATDPLDRDLHLVRLAVVSLLVGFRKQMTVL